MVEIYNEVRDEKAMKSKRIHQKQNKRFRECLKLLSLINRLWL